MVLLYPDGTWRYEYDSNRRDDYSWGRGDSQINIDAGATGKRFGALIDGHLYFIINDGQLEDLYIYDARGRVDVYKRQLPGGLNAMWSRRQTTKFNGASYISQRGAAAIYTLEGKAEVRANIDYYLQNACLLYTSRCV